jgi:activator of Hsp90 ATPase-like protein
MLSIPDDVTLEHLSTPPDIRHQVMVDGDSVRAFNVFIDVGSWWPLAIRSVLSTGAMVGFVDGRLVEQSVDGESAVWGTVSRWAPGVAVALTWHPGRSPERAGLLEVTFTAAGAKTLVTLEHSGWDGYDDPAGARDDYYRGWPRMLALFRDKVNARLDGTI